MDSLFFIKRYMGSDEEDEDHSQQVSTSSKPNKSINTSILKKHVSNLSDNSTVFDSKEEEKFSAVETDSVIEVNDSDCSVSIKGSRYRNSDVYCLNSETKSRKKISGLEKHVQNLREEKFDKPKSNLKAMENVSCSSSVETGDEIEILGSSNAAKSTESKSFDIGKKSSSGIKSLKMFKELGSSSEIINDSYCTNSIQDTRNDSSDFSEKVIIGEESMKKKRKVKNTQVLQSNEWNGLQKWDYSKFSNEKSGGLIEDTTNKNQVEVTDFEPKRAKKQKTDKKAQAVKECVPNTLDLDDTEEMDCETVKETKRRRKSKENFYKECNSNLSNSENAEEALGQMQEQHRSSSVEALNEIEILDNSNAVKSTVSKSFDIAEKGSLEIKLLKMLEDLDSFSEVEKTETTNSSHCTNFVQDTRTVSSDSSKKVIEEKSKEKKKSRKKKQKCNSNVSNSENTEEAFRTIGQVQHQKDINCRQILPDWLSNPTYINLQEEKTDISELKYLGTILKNNLMDSGITFLLPVQSTVMPLLMKNYVSERRLMFPPSDICVCAPTGSGKTLTFVLPIVEALKERVVTAIRALVVLPVSELAIQVYKVFKSVIRGTDLQVALLIGQKSFHDEQKKLVRFTRSTNKALSLVDIIVTTPGRIRDHIYRTDCFCLKWLRYLVIDEADRMMDEIQQGWLRQIEDAIYKDSHPPNCICSGRPTKRKKSTERTCALDYRYIMEPLQKLLCSATLTHDPEQLHTLDLFKPKLFTASTSNSEQKLISCPVIPDKLTTFQVICVEGTKPMIICHLIKQHQFKRVLCFTESVERTHKLNLLLEAMGLKVREISSIKKAVQRKIVLKQFASGTINVLVCSDLLTRGIDIENVDCVISYDVPQCDKMYVHRIGRTARAGKSGTAITLLSENETSHFKKILKLSELEIPDTINIQSEDLKPLLKSYQDALARVEANLRSKKHERFGKKQDRFGKKQDRFGKKHERFGKKQERFGKKHERFGKKVAVKKTTK